MVDNFNKIIDHILKFENEEEFYFLQILQRKKENDLMSSNNRIIKTYYFYSKDQILRHKEEIIKLCELFNARAYINLNRRNARKAALDMMVLLATQIKNNQVDHISKIYNTVVGQQKSDKDKTWILDIDSKDQEYIDEVIYYVNNNTEPYPQVKFIISIPTKNGVHLITKPFDPRGFTEKFSEIEIHKNNPTIIYCL